VELRGFEPMALEAPTTPSEQPKWPNLVTQAEFVELTKMEPIDLYILIQHGKVPVVKTRGLI
jgi:hypothetical protein